MRRKTAQYFPLADNIVILSDATIKEQGTWDNLRIKSSRISKIIHPDTEAEVLEDYRSAPGQTRATTIREASKDLNRKVGDFSLYGMSRGALRKSGRY